MRRSQVHMVNLTTNWVAYSSTGSGPDLDYRARYRAGLGGVATRRQSRLATTSSDWATSAEYAPSPRLIGPHRHRRAQKRTHHLARTHAVPHSRL
eukprot:1943980-Pyramimonas_sp.AAC.2